jgi:hypothetical protein
MKPDYRKAMWCLYDYSVNRAPRKETLRRMIACGLTARQAIEEMWSVEQEG